MAEGLSVGTVTGRVELDDQMSPALDALGGRIEKVEGELGELGGRVEESSSQHKELGSVIEGISQRFERAAERVAEYFAIREAAKFIEDLFTSAHALDLLSQQTDISIESLQVLGAATEAYGITNEQLGRQIFQLSRRIAGGDQSAATALHMMGLTIGEVQNLKPEDLFMTITHALGDMQGPLKDVAASDLFGGRLGKSILAFSKDADAAMAQARESITVTSTQSVKDLSELDVEVQHLKTSFENWARELVGHTAQMENVKLAAIKVGGQWETFKAQSKDLFDQVTGLGTGTEHLTKLLVDNGYAQDKASESARKSVEAHAKAAEVLTAEGQAAKFMAALQLDAAKALEPWQIKDLEHLKEIGQLNEKNAAAIGVNSTQFKEYETKVKETEAAVKLYKQALTEMDSVGANWHETLTGIDQETVEGVKYYLDAGIAQNKLAAAYGLTDTQVKAIAESNKAAAEGLKLLTAATKAEHDAENELVQVRINLQQRSLKNQMEDETTALKARYQAGAISEREYQQGLYSVKEEYARRSEGLYRQTHDVEIAVQKEALNKQLNDLETQYNKGKIDTEDYEKTKAEIRKTYADKMEGIDLKYAADAADRKRAEQNDLKNVADGVDNVGQHIEILDHNWVTDADIAAATINKTTVMVKTLDGEVISLADAQKRQQAGSTTDVTSTNFQDMVQGFNTQYDSLMKTGQFIGLPKQIDPAAAEELAHKGYSWSEIVSILTGSIKNPGPPSGPRIPGFREGGVGDFGSGTIAMLHGREAVVPLERGIGFGQGISITNYVNGTAAETARKVSDEIMRTLKQQRQFGAA